MQSIYKKIFEIAVAELPEKHYIFIGEEAVLYRGFKSSKSNKSYNWQDTRFSNYYEPVDPKITENILLKGFTKTLTEVMIHNDKDKLLTISREICEKDALIAYWAKESTRIWAEYSKKIRVLNKNEKIKDEVKKKRKSSAKKGYMKKKSLYNKKREVIHKERLELKEDIKFFEARIRLYNN